MEIRFPSQQIFIYIDENKNGFAKAYRVPEGEMTEEISVNSDNLVKVMKELVKKCEE